MKNLREHIVELLRAEHAHADFYNAVAGLPEEQRGVRPANFPHSAWELAEHMRIAQWDILEYIVNPDHVSPKFPDGYWPAGPAPRSEEEWTNCVQGFLTDLTRLITLVSDESNDLLAPVPFANNATIMRQALLAADHNAYHIGQLVSVRRLLGVWGS